MLQNKLKASLLALVIIPTFTFAAQCTQDERIGLKENGYSQKEIVELCGKEQKMTLPIVQKPLLTPYVMIRTGFLTQNASSEDTIYYNNMTYKNPSFDSEGSVISLVLGINDSKGFDIRALISYEALSFSFDKDQYFSQENIFFGTEFAYNFTDKFALYYSLKINEDDLRSGVGINGKFGQSLGYYVMYQSGISSIINEDEPTNEDIYIEDISVITIGLTYTF